MKTIFLTVLAICLALSPLSAQKKKDKENSKTEKTEEKEEKLNLSGLKFRSVGPALTSGRISDFAVDPSNPYNYYIATASGGVWKTINNGVTYEPIFDSQGSYSIGCITMDPSDHETIWVGTGENNNQRSVAYGDGVYKSTDGGQSWKHMGLKMSEHIGKIIVHPTNSNIIWVAAIGPLWNSGGERGVYKSTDGGQNWEAVLEIDEHTGVTDLVIDPTNPDILYAAAFQRARHVYTYLGGGPGSGIYKSTDGGQTWNTSMEGLPKVDLGRIGLTISPADPTIIYAIVEAAMGKSGFYRSTNGGNSWDKRGSYVTSGNYYQEIVADPKDPDVIYGMDTWLHVSKDGGKSFHRTGESTKHVDNHCMWIDPQNTEHWLVGCDGGIYETYDAAKTWAFKPNLPVTQFYKVAVDNDAPFYHIYGGTQDNFSLGGPARTNTAHGIVNSDWFITHGGDGFESQIDPQNPNIVYAQSQYGVLVRYDRLSGEEVGIQPIAGKNENDYRWNWDAPLIASPHAPGRVYFAANKVFRSDDYGNSWDVISDDLTRQLNRNELEIMGRIWSMDAVAKNRSTSPYGTLVALAESPINSNLLIAGSDDGLIHISEDGGDSWRKIDGIAGSPERSYVNAVYASQHDENVMYAVFNHHKYGDFKPYIYRSSDKGGSWTSISSDLPERGSVYSIEEDHLEADLLFCGTEFGVFYSNNAGDNWTQLKAGVPTIAVRDLAIQRREDDLVLGTFGRGFYVLDDYTSLRTVEKDMTSQLMPVRDALLFERNQPLGLPGKAFQGDQFYCGDNLSSVALISYYMSEDKKTLEEQRKESEKELRKEKAAIKYPTYEELRAERDEIKPHLLFTIVDENDNVVRKYQRDISKGLHRFEWDLRYSPKTPIRLSRSDFYNPFGGRPEGTLVGPGNYTIKMEVYENNSYTTVGNPVTFEVKALENTVLPAKDRNEKIAFQQEVNDLNRSVRGAGHLLGEIKDKLRHIEQAILMTDDNDETLTRSYFDIKKKVAVIQRELNGDREKSELDIDQPPSVSNRIGRIMYEQKYSTSEPTQTHRDSYQIAKEEFDEIKEEIKSVATKDIPQLEQKLEDAGAPYTPGRALLMME